MPGDAAEADEGGAELVRVAAGVERLIGTHELVDDIRGDRRARGAHRELAVGHRHQRADLEPRVDVGSEAEGAMDANARDGDIADRIVRDDLPVIDANDVSSDWNTVG